MKKSNIKMTANGAKWFGIGVFTCVVIKDGQRHPFTRSKFNDAGWVISLLECRDIEYTLSESRVEGMTLLAFVMPETGDTVHMTLDGEV